MGKTFTLEEANRTLVFVAPIMKEIQAIWAELMDTKANPEQMLESSIRGKVERLKYCNEELAQVGCIAKDPGEGTLDFPSFYKNKPIFLCWKQGEEQIEFWHDVHDGYEGRREINEDFLNWNSSIPAPDLSAA